MTAGGNVSSSVVMRPAMPSLLREFSVQEGERLPSFQVVSLPVRTTLNSLQFPSSITP